MSSSPPQQTPTTPSPWWRRPCRVGWIALRFFWATIVLGVVLKVLDALVSWAFSKESPLQSLNLWPILYWMQHNLFLAVFTVNSSEKIPKSATPKVSRSGEFYVGTVECQSKNPQNVCSLKRCPSFVIYKPSYLLLISLCPSPCVFGEEEGLLFTGFALRSWNTPALRFSRRR